MGTFPASRLCGLGHILLRACQGPLSPSSSAFKAVRGCWALGLHAAPVQAVSVAVSGGAQVTEPAYWLVGSHHVWLGAAARTCMGMGVHARQELNSTTVDLPFRKLQHVFASPLRLDFGLWGWAERPQAPMLTSLGEAHSTRLP